MSKEKNDNKSTVELDKEFKVADANMEEKPEMSGGDLGLDREILGDEKYIEALEEKLGQCMAESVMCRNLTQRIQADFDNYRKRNAALSEEMKQLGVSMVVEKMLTVLDNCDLARKYISDESALMGFNMMEQQIISALSGFGLEEVKALDLPFDVKSMCAVESVGAKGKEDIVLEVVSKGFKLNGKLLRPASVKVGK